MWPDIAGLSVILLAFSLKVEMCSSDAMFKASRKAQVFPEAPSGLPSISHWPELDHMITLAAREAGKIE